MIPPREIAATNDIARMREYFQHLCEVTSAFQMKSMREYAVQQDEQLAADLFRSLGVSYMSGEQLVDLSALAVQLSTAQNRDAAKIIAKLTRTSHDVEILALFSNPSFFQLDQSRRRSAVGNLNLMREMRHLQSKVPPQNCVIMAGSTLEDFESILTRVSPRILQFSGHCSGVTRSLLIFEKDETGDTLTFSVEQFQKLIEKSNLQTLELM